MGFIRKLKPFNRRRFPRIEPDNCLEYTCSFSEGGKQIKITVDILDISEGGMLLITGDNKIPMDAEIVVEFQFPGKSEKNQIKAEVVRTYRREHGKWWYSGVEFADRAQPSIKALFDFIVEKAA
ncbi:MAG: PilZ domain-containing protein [Candidatus Omnitrophota bacterium]